MLQTWSADLASAVRRRNLKFEPTKSVWIASDYSRSNDRQQTFSFLFVAPDECQEWNHRRSEFRSRVRDKISWKAIVDPPDRKHRDFIRILTQLSGILVTVSMDAEDVSTLPTKDALTKLLDKGKLTANWKPMMLWRASAIAQSIVRIASEITVPTQSIRFLSDSDEAFLSTERVQDAFRIAFVDLEESRKQQFRDAVFIPTDRDDETRTFADLLAVPDLACGFFHSHLYRRTSDTRPGRSEIVSDWLAIQSPQFSSIFVRFKRDPHDRLIVDEFSFRDVFSG